MAKRVKIEELYLVISKGGSVVGCGIDAPSACRDAVENSGLYTNWKDMALSGWYAVTTATANATYDKEKLDECFDCWRRAADEHYGKRANP
ncbi:hypothetical protein CDJ04_13845 [Salmonella enterica]|nr:hypothetical protein [Salmonella enterica]EBZ5140107.1 hypothetical protein [Salmonella enterica subsp. enterica serovar Antsalova]ECS6899714.1 hypothetical protein [Salmonella enterica]EHI8599349.1 hypothetical protein [Salmonella enterica subsp. enterica serovar 51:z:1,5]EHI8983501.1 hypothetical protein [Salmonella enterica subsp. enterica serovar 51:z:1,5]